MAHARLLKRRPSRNGTPVGDYFQELPAQTKCTNCATNTQRKIGKGKGSSRTSCMCKDGAVRPFPYTFSSWADMRAGMFHAHVSHLCKMRTADLTGFWRHDGLLGLECWPCPDGGECSSKVLTAAALRRIGTGIVFLTFRVVRNVLHPLVIRCLSCARCPQGESNLQEPTNPLPYPHPTAPAPVWTASLVRE